MLFGTNPAPVSDERAFVSFVRLENRPMMLRQHTPSRKPLLSLSSLFLGFCAACGGSSTQLNSDNNPPPVRVEDYDPKQMTVSLTDGFHLPTAGSYLKTQDFWDEVWVNDSYARSALRHRKRRVARRSWRSPRWRSLGSSRDSAHRRGSAEALSLEVLGGSTGMALGKPLRAPRTVVRKVR